MPPIKLRATLKGITMNRRSILGFAAAALGAASVPALASSSPRLRLTRAQVDASVERGQYFDVYLDGVLIKNVLDGDCIEGWVVQGDMTPDGQYQLNDDRTTVKTVLRRGLVELVAL
jgi:hypothetical protein